MKPQSREGKKNKRGKQRDVSFRLDADKVTTFAKQPSHPPCCPLTPPSPFPFFLSARWTRNSWNVQLQLGHGVTHPFPIYITIYIWMDRQMSALCAPLFSPNSPFLRFSPASPRQRAESGSEDEERFRFSRGGVRMRVESQSRSRSLSLAGFFLKIVNIWMCLTFFPPLILRNSAEKSSFWGRILIC